MAAERRALAFAVFSVGAGLALDSTDFCSPSDVVFSLAPAASLFSVWVLLRKLPKLRCGETGRFGCYKIISVLKQVPVVTLVLRGRLNCISYLWNQLRELALGWRVNHKTNFRRKQTRKCHVVLLLDLHQRLAQLVWVVEARALGESGRPELQRGTAHRAPRMRQRDVKKRCQCRQQVRVEVV